MKRDWRISLDEWWDEQPFLYKAKIVVVVRPWNRLVRAWDRSTNFFRRVWQHRRWLSNDCDFDFICLADIMESKLRRMGEHFKAHDFHMDSQTIATECLEAADILKAMLHEGSDFNESEYIKLSDEEKTAYWVNKRAEEEVRIARFGELMTRMQGWWD